MTAYDATKEYAPGNQVTLTGTTYVNSSDDAVQGVSPPAWPWEAVGTLAVGAAAAHQGAVSAPAAQTSTAVTTANATDLATAEALANANKTVANALVADVTALRTTVAALVTAVNALNTALQTGGQEASS